jgi:porin
MPGDPLSPLGKERIMIWWKCGILIVGFLVSMAMAENSAAQNVPVQASSPRQSWLSQQTATGDWGGIRNTLKNKGLTIASNFTTDLATNPSGGEKRGSTYAGFLSAGLALNFEKLADLQGLSLNLSGYWLSGRSLSEKYIGNLFGVQEISAPGTYYFGQLNLSQSLFNDTLTIEAGRLFAADVFATNPLWGYYVNGGININLNSIPVNIFFPEFQVAAWGARAAYQPAKEWHFIAGIYNADPSVAGTNKHGLDFSLDTSKGALAIGQVTYQHHQAREADGLPGRISLGGYYESNKFSILNNPSGQSWGNYGGYFIIDQMIYRGSWPEYNGPSHLRSGASHAERAKHPYQPQSASALDRPYGLTAWFGLYAAPKESINKQMLQLAGGLVYQGLLPNRDRDVTALGIVSGKFSNQLKGQGTETFVEFNHRFQVSPWFYVTPDIQYIINPNGSSHIPNALVLAMEVSVNF